MKTEVLSKYHHHFVVRGSSCDVISFTYNNGIRYGNLVAQTITDLMLHGY